MTPSQSVSMDVTHRRASVNGVELHVAEQGEGRPVILAHGFPELWYSWRHQLQALADAGYRAIAPDMRGYGDSEIPPGVEAYDFQTVADDLLGLLDQTGEESCVFVGHDLGAAVVWSLARAHPERVAGVVALSVPFLPQTPTVAALREGFGDDFYIVRFQEPGVADEALSRDVRRTLLGAWARDWQGGIGHVQPDLERPAEAGEDASAPEWISDQEAEVYFSAFERTGFTGGLNYFRNMDRNAELTEPYKERALTVPALFITGEGDPVRGFMPDQVMDEWVPDLRGRVVVEGAGHWVQQERPDQVNVALREFLHSVGY